MGCRPDRSCNNNGLHGIPEVYESAESDCEDCSMVNRVYLVLKYEKEYVCALSNDMESYKVKTAFFERNTNITCGFGVRFYKFVTLINVLSDKGTCS